MGCVESGMHSVSCKLMYGGSGLCTHVGGVLLGRSCGSPVLNFRAFHFANRRAIILLQIGGRIPRYGAM